MQFVLLTFKPDRDIELLELEELSGLDSRDILNARWIKPATRCTLNQMCGHAIFSLTLPQVANEILVHGLFICHKVYAEKCKEEPLRCLNCQQMESPGVGMPYKTQYLQHLLAGPLHGQLC